MILSILGSLFNDDPGDSLLSGVRGGMLLPIPSTGASRLLRLFKVGVLEKKERTLDVRFG